MATETTKSKVAAINEKHGKTATALDETAVAAALAKDTKSETTKKTVETKKPTEMTMKYALKGNRAVLPSSMIRIEVGKWDGIPRVKINTGFAGYGNCRVFLGLPLPDGGLDVFATINFKVEVKDTKIRLICPFYVSDDKTDDEGAYMALATFIPRDRIARTVAKIIHDKKAISMADFNADNREFQVVYTYDTNPKMKAFELAE